MDLPDLREWDGLNGLVEDWLIIVPVGRRVAFALVHRFAPWRTVRLSVTALGPLLILQPFALGVGGGPLCNAGQVQLLLGSTVGDDGALLDSEGPDCGYGVLEVDKGEAARPRDWREEANPNNVIFEGWEEDLKNIIFIHFIDVSKQQCVCMIRVNKSITRV